MVDLCCGSGSGLIAAVSLGYPAAGFDISQSQVDATKARLQQLSQKKVLFFSRKLFCVFVAHGSL